MRRYMNGWESGALNFIALSSGASISTVQKRTGSYSMYIGGNNHYATAVLPAALDEFYLRLGLYPTTLWSADSAGPTFLTLYDTYGAQCLGFGIASGTLLLRLDNASYVGIANGIAPITLNAWNCIEAHVKIADAPNGQVDFKINGVADLSFSGDTLLTSGTAVRALGFGYRSYSSYPKGTVWGYYDDIAVNDATGGVNDSWVGQGGIRLGFVDGNSAEGVAFTPSTGTNWECVDEIPVSDADYVSSDTLDAEDLYTLDTSSMPAAGIVSAVQWIGRGKLSVDGGSMTPVIRSGGTTEQQTDIPLSVTMLTKGLIMDVDPIDDAAWTVAKVNALEVGVAVGAAAS